ncbi:hypothetical protein AB2F46_25340 (plasmid) [Escherichia coli]
MIIKPAIAELNEKKPDLVVTVETIKKGRTVVALHLSPRKTNRSR